MARVDEIIGVYKQLERHAGRANAQLARTKVLAEGVARSLNVSLRMDTDRADSNIQRLLALLLQLNDSAGRVKLTMDTRSFQAGLNRIYQRLTTLIKEAKKLVDTLKQASSLVNNIGVSTPSFGPGGAGNQTVSNKPSAGGDGRLGSRSNDRDNGGNSGNSAEGSSNGDKSSGPKPTGKSAQPASTPSIASKMANGISSSFGEVAEKAKQIFTIENAVSFLNWSDQIAAVNDRLQLVNDGTMTQAKLQQKVMQAANGARQPYQDIAGMIAEMGTSNAFKNNDEMIGFASRFEKVLTAGSASPDASNDARSQIAETFAAGSLDTNGLDTLTRASPVFLKVLADGLGVSRKKLYQLAEQGNLTSAELVRAFSGQDVLIGKAFAEAPVTFSQSMTLAKNKAAEWVSQLNGADGPLQKVNESVMLLVQWLDTQQGQGLLTSLNAGILLLSDGIASLTSFIVDHMGVIIGVLIGLAAVLAFVAIQWLVGWIMAMLPMLLVAAAIGGIIAILLSLGVTVQQIVGVVMGIFNTLFALIWNGIAYVWNIVLAFAEFFVNVFSDPVYAVQKLFYDLMQNFMGVMYNMLRSGEDFAGGFMKVILDSINGALKGVNGLLKAWNKLTGANIQPIELFDETNVHALSDKLKQQMDGMKPPDPAKGKSIDFSKYKMDQKNLSGAFNDGLDYGSDLVGRASNKLAGTKERGFGLPNLKDPLAGSISDSLGGAGKTPNIANIDKVGEVNKIGESVEISSEDLKSMRELAEMKNIQNFVSLTPSISFGDTHVRNESDVQSIITKIQEHLETEFASSVEGVHR